MSALSIFLILVTILRMAIATLGHYGEAESYLLLCSHHLDWGFVEGPAGLPALIKLGTSLFGNTPLGIRFFSPLMMLGASWSLAQLTGSLFKKDKKNIFWSVVAFNLLPLANAASVVMEGTIIVSGFWIIAVGASWNLLSKEENKLSYGSWIFFGLLLALGTQFSYAIGWLLPVVFLLIFLTRSLSQKNLTGIGIALVFLLLGWTAPLWWNFHHDMIQWSAITWGSFWSWEPPRINDIITSPLFWFLPLIIPFLLLGIFVLRAPRCGTRKNVNFLLLVAVPFIFYIGAIGHHQCSLALLLTLVALLLPGAVTFLLQNSFTKKTGACLLLLATFFSLSFLFGIFSPSAQILWNLPSPRGTIGVQKIAVELLRLRAEETAASGHAPFIIAETPGLAALIGMSLPITYPELPEAPSVFIPESPAMMSQFQWWPNYADATATATIDPLYTEEKRASPLLGRNAFFITTESLDHLPETLQRSFEKIKPLHEVSLEADAHKKTLMIYRCENYQMMAL